VSFLFVFLSKRFVFSFDFIFLGCNFPAVQLELLEVGICMHLVLIAQGSLECVKGSLECVKGSLECVKGSLECVKGSLECVKGSLECVKGSLES